MLNQQSENGQSTIRAYREQATPPVIETKLSANLMKTENGEKAMESLASVKSEEKSRFEQTNNNSQIFIDQAYRQHDDFVNTEARNSMASLHEGNNFLQEMQNGEKSRAMVIYNEIKYIEQMERNRKHNEAAGQNLGKG